MNRYSFLPWIVVLVIVAAGVAVLSTRERPSLDQQGPAIGQPLQGLHLQPLTMEGQELTLDDLKGEVLLVNYWGTWCPPCVEEFPHLASLAQRMNDAKGFRLLSVSCGSGDESFEGLKSETEAFLAEQDFPLGVYWDPRQESRRALYESAKMQSFGYPCTVVVDRQGAIAGLWLGYQDGYVLEMESLVRSLLKAPPEKTASDESPPEDAPSKNAPHEETPNEAASADSA